MRKKYYRKTSNRIRKQDEADIQETFFKVIAQLPELRRRCFHIPNGGKRNIREAMFLKRQGVLSGVFDVFLAIPNHLYNGLWIEFKAGKNCLTENQHIFMQEMQDSGYDCQIFYTWNEAFDYVKIYLQKTAHRIL